jgi:hypothetical protein
MTNLIISTEEIWKDIPGYEGKYKISNYGKVVSYSWTRFFGTDNKARIDYPEIQKKIHINKDGYPVVGLSIKGKEKKFRVHKLVALTFIPNPENKPEVNHKDANKQNNHVNNLEWATHQENMDHCFALGLRKKQYIRKPKVYVSKVCTKCNIEKPITDFRIVNYKTGEQGRRPRCKSCEKKLQQLRRNTYYEKISLEGEIWKDIPLDNCNYEISTLGRVRHKNSGKVLTPKKHTGGYHQVSFYVLGTSKTKYYFVHRLMAQTFLYKEDDKPMVLHRDGNKENNKLDNLFYGTKRDSKEISEKLGRHTCKGETHYSAKKVIDISTGKIYGTIKEAALNLGFERTGIERKLKGNRVNDTTLRYYEQS